MSKGTEPAKATRVGGAILGSSATLRIFGETLDPDALTELLKRPPTSSYKVGDRISPRVAALRKQGMWRLESPLSRTATLSDQILELLSQLSSEASVWEEITRKHKADIYCGIDIRLPNSGTELTAATVAALAVRKLSVQFDFYALPEEDEALPVTSPEGNERN